MLYLQQQQNNNNNNKVTDVLDDACIRHSIGGLKKIFFCTKCWEFPCAIKVGFPVVVETAFVLSSYVRLLRFPVTYNSLNYVGNYYGSIRMATGFCFHKNIDWLFWSGILMWLPKSDII